MSVTLTNPSSRMRRSSHCPSDARSSRGLGQLEHTPVLLPQLVSLMAPSAGDTFIDCTFGGGGHAEEIARSIGPGGTLIAIDRDPVAAERFDELKGRVQATLRFIKADFCEGLTQLAGEDVSAKGVYMDLGISSLQVDAKERGFSYSYDAPLDMRMDPGQEVSALQVVNEWPQDELAQIMRNYGEERYSRRIAASIARERDRRQIETTGQLAELIVSAIPTPARFGAGHPARRAFQAVRIAVNDELEQLKMALPLAWQLLANDGTLCAISFHSLEDRIVKRFIAGKAKGCTCPPGLPVCACGKEAEAERLTRKPVVPGEGEIAGNPRARSARLRAARKIGG